jgi:hypothetical protein
MDDELSPGQRFARAKSRYVEALLASTALTHFEVRLGITMCQLHANFERFVQTGLLVSWAGQALMASETGATVPGVRKAERHLVQHGYARKVRAGLGRGWATEYELTIPFSQSRHDFVSDEDKRGGPVEEIDDNSSTTVPHLLHHGSAKRCTSAPPTLKKEPSEDTQSARGGSAFDQWLAIMPRRMQRIGNLHRARDAWGPAVRTYGADRLLGAARAYAADPDVAKLNYLPAIQNWLIEGLFEQFLPTGEASSHAVLPPEWDGPPEVRAALVKLLGEERGADFVGSYLSRACWDGTRRVITPKTSTAKRALEEHRSQWARLGITIAEPMPLAPRVRP